jgi:hypothetical protein
MRRAYRVLSNPAAILAGASVGVLPRTMASSAIPRGRSGTMLADGAKSGWSKNRSAFHFGGRSKQVCNFSPVTFVPGCGIFRHT